MKRMFKYLGMWLLAGPFLSIFIAAKDVYQFCILLKRLKGCRDYKNLDVEGDEEGHDERDEVRIYEWVREIVINLYLEKRNNLIKEGREEDPPIEYRDCDGNPLEKVEYKEDLDLIDLLEEDKEFIEENTEHFSIKATEIEAMWVKDKAKKLLEKQRLQQAEEKSRVKSGSDSDGYTEHHALS